MDTEHQDTEWDVFPTGLYRTEWSEGMKTELDGMAQMIDRDRAIKAMRAAKAKCREKFATPPPPSPVPVLGCPSGRLLGEAPPHHAAQPDPREGSGPPACPRQETSRHPTPSNRCPPEPGPNQNGKPEAGQSGIGPRCRCLIEPEAK
jgi:hypothetical protein